MLLALNRRTVSVEELTGFARVIRTHASPVFAADEPRLTGLVDTCGTGGDETGTFNISTAAAIVAAAAGARVAKHATGPSVPQRLADVLEALGVRIDLPMTAAGRSVREIGIGFLFAPPPTRRRAMPRPPASKSANAPSLIFLARSRIPQARKRRSWAFSPRT